MQNEVELGVNEVVWSFWVILEFNWMTNIDLLYFYFFLFYCRMEDFDGLNEHAVSDPHEVASMVDM